MKNKNFDKAQKLLSEIQSDSMAVFFTKAKPIEDAAKFIADQAQNITADGKVDSQVGNKDAYKDTVAAFGKELTDLCVKIFPAKKFGNGGSVENEIVPADKLLEEAKPYQKELVEKWVAAKNEQGETPTKYDIQMYEYALLMDLAKAIGNYIEKTDGIKDVKFSKTKGVIVITCTVVRGGTDYWFSTQMIYAGGYNIQQLHYRYLVDTKLPRKETNPVYEKMKSIYKGMDTIQKAKKQIADSEIQVNKYLAKIEDLKQEQTKPNEYFIQKAIVQAPYLLTSWEQVIKNGATAEGRHYHGWTKEQYTEKQNKEIQHDADELKRSVGVYISHQKDFIKSAEKTIARLKKKIADLGDVKFEKGGTTALLAPNGKPSNLTPEQWHLVRTPAFKAWFGDWENDPANASKVVDSNNEPLVCYHGTGKQFYEFNNQNENNFYKDIKIAKLGFYFTNNKDTIAGTSALEYAHNANGDIVMECFLNIRNPYLLEDTGYTSVVSMVDKNESRLTSLDKSKYDGIIAADLDSDFEKFGVEKNYIAFSPNQIKLADGTNTTFDASTNDIRFENGGTTELLAPNGNPSNLTPEQWHLVRTFEFKKWFGWWDKQGFAEDILKQKPYNYILKTEKTINSFATHTERNKYILDTAKSIKKQTPIISNTDIGDISITIDGLQHSLRHSSEKIMFDSIWHIAKILSNSKYFDKDHNTKQSTNKDAEYFVYLFNNVKFRNETYIFRASVKYSKANKCYMLHDYNIELLNEKNEIKPVSANKANLSSISFSECKDKRINVLCKTFSLNISKCVDSNGEPLICYHGTTKEFNEFLMTDKFREEWNVRDYGAYFTSDKDTAKFYSLDFSKKKKEYEDFENKLKELEQTQNWDEWKAIYNERKEKFGLYDLHNQFESMSIRQFFLSVRNPFIIDGKGEHWYKVLKGAVDAALVMKCDGIIAKDIIEQGGKPQTTYSVFHPNQIKLADGTNTTFDASTNDIRYEGGGSIGEQIEERLQKQQANKEFKDVGRVQQTKKEKAAYRLITANMLSELENDGIMAYNMVRKDTVWAEINVEEERGRGVTSGAVYLKVKIREAVPTRPKDDKQARATYVLFLTALQNDLIACFNVDDIAELFTKYSEMPYSEILGKFIDPKYFSEDEVSPQLILNELDAKANPVLYKILLFGQTSRLLIRTILDEVFSVRLENLIFKASDAGLAVWHEARDKEPISEQQSAQLIEKSKEREKKFVDSNNVIIEEYKNYSIKDLLNAMNTRWKIGSGNKAVYKQDPEKFRKWTVEYYEKRIAEELPKFKAYEKKVQPRENDWSWIEPAVKVGAIEKPKAEAINTKTPLEYIKRTGGYKIENISTQAIIDNFGFNAANYGVYVDDKWSKDHTKHFLGAISDLGEMLNIDIKQMNQLGKLSIAFGAKGRAGHLAAYFPQTKDINLTKGNGDGSVAHEWGHYFDNVIVELDTKKATNSFASQGYASDYKLKSLFANLTDFFFKGDPINGTPRVPMKFYAVKGNGTAPSYVRKSSENWSANWVNYTIEIKPTIEETIDSVIDLAVVNKEWHSRQVKIFGYIIDAFGLETYDVPMKLTTSYYFFKSAYSYFEYCYNDGKNIVRAGEPRTKYWISTVELFARAWETVVLKKLLDKNRVSNYLVNDIPLADIISEKYHKPYPTGKELEYIEILIDKIIAEVKIQFNIGSFVPVSDVREDEYVDLEIKESVKVDKKIGSDVKEVILETPATKVVVEGQKNADIADGTSLMKNIIPPHSQQEINSDVNVNKNIKSEPKMLDKEKQSRIKDAKYKIRKLINFMSSGNTKRHESFVNDIMVGFEKGLAYNKLSLQRIGEEHGIDDANEVKDLSELAIVKYCRKLAHSEDKTVEERYKTIVDFYENQPNLSQRTSESVLFQQYSTPAPIAYLMGVYCGFDKEGKNVDSPMNKYIAAYHAIKQKYDGAIAMFRDEDVCFTIMDDAIKVAQVLDIPIEIKDGIKQTKFGWKDYESNLQSLVKSGNRVAVVDANDNPVKETEIKNQLKYAEQILSKSKTIYAYKRGDEVLFLDNGNKLQKAIIIAPFDVENNIQIWKTNKGEFGENKIVPTIISAKMESIGQGYKMFRKTFQNDIKKLKQYTIRFADGYVYDKSFNSDSANDAKIKAVEDRLRYNDYPETQFVTVGKELNGSLMGLANYIGMMSKSIDKIAINTSNKGMINDLSRERASEFIKDNLEEIIDVYLDDKNVWNKYEKVKEIAATFANGGVIEEMMSGNDSEKFKTHVFNVLNSDPYYFKKDLSDIVDGVIKVDRIILKYNYQNPIKSKLGMNVYFFPDPKLINRERKLKTAYIKYAAHLITRQIQTKNEDGSIFNQRSIDTSKIRAIEMVVDSVLNAEEHYLQKRDGQPDSIIYYKKNVGKNKNVAYSLAIETNMAGELRLVTIMPNKNKKSDNWFLLSPNSLNRLQNIGVEGSILNFQKDNTSIEQSEIIGKDTSSFELGGNILLKNVKYFEPSAGNGMLTIAGEPKDFIVNELAEFRNKNLKSQGYAEVMQVDASLPFTDFAKKFDGIITNPPFGSIETTAEYGGFKITSLEHLMALRALDTMKDDGRAAIIIGGHTSWDSEGRIQAGKNRIFFNYLYHFYKVDDVINISGRDLYSRMGTSFNVRVILIAGRKTVINDDEYAPLKKDFPANVANSSSTVDDFNILFERIISLL